MHDMWKIVRLLSALCAVALIAACARSEQPPPVPRGAGVAGQPAVAARAPRGLSPAPSTEALSRLVAGNTAFAADLHARLRGSPGNFAYSPASISMALGMTYAGAQGETAAQMRRTMHYDVVDDATLHAGFGHLLATWNDPGETDYELRVANRLFGEQTMDYVPPFLATTRDTYRAELEQLDF